MHTMLEKAREKNREDGGFTLIELLVVIVIIGILAGIVVFAVGGIRDKGDESACKADARTVETAEEAYGADHDGTYATEQELVDDELLKTLSDLHDVTVPAGAASYAIVDQASGDTDCPAYP